MSLKERLAALENAGNSWKQRVSKEIIKKNDIQVVKGELAVSTETWRNRVEKKDAENFTPEGKLRNDGIETAPPPAPKTPPPSNSISAPLILTNNDAKIFSSSNFNPSDYETFGSFFQTSINSQKIEISNLNLPREELLKNDLKKPRRPRKDPVVSKKDVVKKALEAKCNYDVVLKKVEKIEKKEDILWVIKGAKNALVRIWNVAMGLDLGDCYVGWFDGCVWVFRGNYANLRENLKTTEFVQFSRHTTNVVYQSVNWTKFLSLCGLPEDYIPSSSGSEDDIAYESAQLQKLKVYEYKDSCFVENVENVDKLTFQWLRRQKNPLLYSFGDGEELYLYDQKSARNEVAMELVSSNFNAKYFRRIRKSLEPIEFRIKFPSWGGEKIVTTRQEKLSPIRRMDFDNVEMIYDEIILENVSFGVTRGVIAMDDDPRKVNFSTKALRRWILSPSPGELDENDFTSSECYVVLWLYSLVYSTKSDVWRAGRDRGVWFFWFGADASTVEKTRISTLFAVEDYKAVLGVTDLDCSGCQQVALNEGSEPSLWHQLFNGAKYKKSDDDSFYKVVFLNDDVFYHVPSDRLGESILTDSVFYHSFNFATKYPNRLTKFDKTSVIDIADDIDGDLDEDIIYKLVPKGDEILIFRIERVLDNYGCYVFPSRRKLFSLTKIENLELRAVAVVSIFERFGEMQVFDGCDCHCDGNRLKVDADCSHGYGLEEVYNFIIRCQGDFTIEEHEELELFRRWHGDDTVWNFLGDGILKELDTNVQEFKKLEPWRRKLKVKPILK